MEAGAKVEPKTVNSKDQSKINQKLVFPGVPRLVARFWPSPWQHGSPATAALGSGNHGLPALRRDGAGHIWIPAFAGMTNKLLKFRDSFSVGHSFAKEMAAAKRKIGKFPTPACPGTIRHAAAGASSDNDRRHRAGSRLRSRRLVHGRPTPERYG